MKVLFVTSRFPYPPFTGDRVRATAWLEAMQSLGELTLVAPPGRLECVPSGCRVVVATYAPHRLLLAAAQVLAQGLPTTALLAAGYSWRLAVRAAAATGGPFDVAIVQLARLDPWIFHLLPPCRRILDAIDALGANLGERAAASVGLASSFWRVEAARTSRLEAACGRRYDAVSVVAASECAAFGERAVAISHGTVLGPPASGPRDIDVAFWGRLAYFANEDAVRVLLEQIWPVVRQGRPNATLLVGGADAPRWMRRWHGQDGVIVESPLRDRPATLRRVRVAVVPLRFGTGASNKLLEAGEASCAVVSTPQGVRGLPELAAEVEIAETPHAIAVRILDLLSSPTMAELQGRRLRGVVESCYSREAACRRFREFVHSVLAAGARGQS